LLDQDTVYVSNFYLGNKENTVYVTLAIYMITIETTFLYFGNEIEILDCLYTLFCFAFDIIWVKLALNIIFESTLTFEHNYSEKRFNDAKKNIRVR